jgi:hypothetical protein
MTHLKADLDALLDEATTFAKSVRAEPRAVTEPNRMPEVNWATRSEREQIVERVANFKAHQQRLMREREDYAAAELARMRASHSSSH